ncbi:hypothetical protein DVH24_032089 [Malus domestica]|uniref:Uncharacterized protein n=1 Tax=Malus domestica TaxID=3750 RepID=A0A498J797_MALDO|nr:hypothetical protein DVH24_032089 [Malus domestica]
MWQHPSSLPFSLSVPPTPRPLSFISLCTYSHLSLLSSREPTPITNPVPTTPSPSLPYRVSSLSLLRDTEEPRETLRRDFSYFSNGNGAGEAHLFFRRTHEFRGNFQSPPTVSRLFEGCTTQAQNFKAQTKIWTTISLSSNLSEA